MFISEDKHTIWYLLAQILLREGSVNISVRRELDSFSYLMTLKGFFTLPHRSDIEPFFLLVLLIYTCISVTDPMLLCVFLQISQQIHRMRQSSKEHQVSVKTVHKYSVDFCNT